MREWKNNIIANFKEKALLGSFPISKEYVRTMSSVALCDMMWFDVCVCVCSYLYSLEKSIFFDYQLFLGILAFYDDYIDVTLIGDKAFEICEGAAMEDSP